MTCFSSESEVSNTVPKFFTVSDCKGLHKSSFQQKKNCHTFVPLAFENGKNLGCLHCLLTYIGLITLHRISANQIVILRWLEIVSWRALPGPLNTATESRLMHAAIELLKNGICCACLRVCTRLAHAQIAILYPRHFWKI